MQFLKSKYNNKKCRLDGFIFASQKELKRYGELKLQEKSGEISNLKLQVPYIIAEPIILYGRKHAARKYIADFVYITKYGIEIVEDTKGFKTEVYLLKRHLMKLKHNIEIVEI